MLHYLTTSSSTKSTWEGIKELINGLTYSVNESGNVISLTDELYEKKITYGKYSADLLLKYLTSEDILKLVNNAMLNNSGFAISSISWLYYAAEKPLDILGTDTDGVILFASKCIEDEYHTFYES